MKQKILIFEWLCGGGLSYDNLDPEPFFSLISQGQEMLQATCADFDKAGLDVIATVDNRLPLDGAFDKVNVDSNVVLNLQLAELCKAVDFVLAIAPETDNRLTNCLAWVASQQAKCLNPNPEFTSLATDKHRLLTHLQLSDVPVPKGKLMDDKSAFEAGIQPPVVVKKVDGCGGEDLKWLADLGEIDDSLDQRYRVEEWIPGTAVSVSVIGGPNPVFLPALRQTFSNQPIGVFQCCVDDLDASLQRRAGDLARQTVAALPATSGYFGIDMVLGDVGDKVIEVNPRITMSYPVLRRKLDLNLAASMLETAGIERSRVC